MTVGIFVLFKLIRSVGGRYFAIIRESEGQRKGIMTILISARYVEVQCRLHFAPIHDGEKESQCLEPLALAGHLVKRRPTKLMSAVLAELH
jgi:hypothetical protein